VPKVGPPVRVLLPVSIRSTRPLPFATNADRPSGATATPCGLSKPPIVVSSLLAVLIAVTVVPPLFVT
jgi:hypothetical protein